MSVLLEQQWKRFTSTGAADGTAVRPVVLEAWKRCRDLGIDPAELRYEFLTPEELESKRAGNADLIRAASPYLDHLSFALSDRAHVIALSDRDGWIIEMREQPPAAFGGRASGICLGSCWSERCIGNNGIGTALERGEPTLVYGIEHYGVPYHQAYCLGVPIRRGGEIIGCLDISVTREEDARPAHLTIAQACVASIESTLGTFSDFKRKNAPLQRFAALGSLLATTLHDMRTPLTVIRGIAQLGRLTAAESDKCSPFDQIVAQVDALKEMIDRVQLQKSGDDFVIASPSALVTEVFEEVRPVCELRGIEVDVRIGEASSVRHAPALLKRSVQNLVSNAIEAMPRGGRLSGHLTTEGPWMRLEVRDTGAGIPQKLRQTLFEPFVHARQGGTGLGLFIVHHTVTELHNGRVWFESEDGQGTRFVIELPASAPGQPRA
jgi:signal transduction histidine kinase